MDFVSYIGAMWELALGAEARGVLFFAALYALLVCAYSMVYQLRVMRWPGVDGRLLESGIERFGATDWATTNQDYVATASYEYVVDGETYVGTRVSPWSMIASHNARFLLARQLNRLQRLPEGGVRVYFDPRHPRKSLLVKPGWLGLALTAVLAAGPLLLYWFAYHR